MTKINVACRQCGRNYHALTEELPEVRCPECGGELAPLEAAPVGAPAAPVPAAPLAPTVTLGASDLAALEQVSGAYRKITAEIEKVIVGQRRVVDEILIAILTNGHALLEGVPGLAKTLMISSLAQALSLTFRRIQFTPDLMPSDITGTDVIQDDPQTGIRGFKFLAGPIFSNVILADEINRTPPKTQAAMLESMQERQVSVGGVVHRMPSPFFVLATQNPLEQEGTYPLPEAQQDRFLFKIFVDYPSDAEEKQIVRRVTENAFRPIEPALGAADILNAQEMIRRVPVADTVIDYAARLVRATRVGAPECPDFVKKWVAWGCGPRATIALVAAGKARAVLRGAACASCEDVADVARPVMRHRFAVNYTARAEGVTPDGVIEKLIEATPKY